MHFDRINSNRRSVLMGFCAVALVVMAGMSPVTAADSSPKLLHINFAWGYTSLSQVSDISLFPSAELTLYRNGTLDVYDGSTDTFYPFAGTWKQRGSRLTLTFPQAVYSGQLKTDGSYTGTMQATNGNAGVWKGIFVP